MPATTTTTSTTSTTAAAVGAEPAELSLEARLAAVDAAMTVALETAAAAIEVNTAHIPGGPLDLADVITVPLPAAPPPPAPYATPVAALLHRAHHRLIADGWCTGALVDAQGARCMRGAIHKEAVGRSLEAQAVDVLLDAVRLQFGPDADSVAMVNDAFGSPRVPLRLLDQAASLADGRGL